MHASVHCGRKRCQQFGIKEIHLYKKYCKIDITEQRNTASVNNKDQPCKKIHFIDHL